MKKFTRLWQVMMVILFTSSVIFAQTTVQDAKKGVADKDYLLKQKQIEQAIVKVKSDGSQVQSPIATRVSDEATTPQKQTKIPKWNTLKAPGGGGPTDDLFCPTSTFDNIFSEDCNGYSSAGTGDTDAGYRIYQGYTGDFTINEIHFWYIHAYFDGTAFGPCASGDEEPVNVEIGFFHDNLLGAGPGTQVGTYTTVSVTGTPTGEMFAGAYEIYEYHYALPASVTITDGWISLMGTVPDLDPACWFMWANSDANPGANNGWQEEIGVGGSDMGYPMALCIYGTNNMVNNVGVTAVTSPVSGMGLTAAELVTIELNNTGSADQIADFPVNFTYMGTTYTETYPATANPLLSGGTGTYTFAQTIDASTVGAYALDACTALPGDELAADDCMPHAFSHFGPYDCTWEIVGYDDYGDSWNGGYIDIYLDGDLHHTWAGPATTGPESFLFGIYEPCTIDIVYIAGGWAYENSYYVYDNFGVEKANDGLGGIDPVGVSGLFGTCIPPACPAPTDLYVDNITGTTADANWTDANMENLYDLCWGLEGFDPDDAGTYVGSTFGFSEFTPVTLYSAPMIGFTYGLTYEFYVRTDCGTDATSIWTKSPTFIAAPPPPNDECVNAQFVGATGYPEVVLGTTLGATVDCPGVLDWNAVWYEIDLPNALNTLNVDYCGTASQATIGIVYYFDCTDCAAYTVADSYEFYDCGDGWNVGKMEFLNIAGPTTIRFPVNQLPQQDFIVTFDVTEYIPPLPPVNDLCEDAIEVFCDDVVPGSTILGTIDVVPLCVYTPTASGVWYKIEGMDQAVTAGLCSPGTTFDTRMNVYSGTCETLVCVDADDDGCDDPTLASVVTFDALVGTTYYILVHGYDVNEGDFDLSISCASLIPPPANDECVNAELVTGPVTTGTTNGATVDCPGVLDWDAVWYAIDLPYECNYIEIDLCLDDAAAVLANTGIILTQDCSCDANSFIYSTDEYVIALNCINELNFFAEGPGIVYYPVMTDPKGDFTFDLLVSECFNIDGTLTYANGAMSPMELDDVSLDDGVVVATTATDLMGDYMFRGLLPGTYTLGGASVKAWGGLTMNDVNFARQHVSGSIVLTGLYWQAAEVTYDGALDMADVLLLRQKVSNNPVGTVFGAPDWLFETPSVIVGPSATQDFQAICAGDVDGSYVPPTAPLGATKYNPIPISYPTDATWANQTNCGFVNTEDETALGSYDGGEDIFYLLTVATAGDYNISVDTKGTTYTGILISDDMDFTTVLDMNTNSGSTGLLIEALSLAAGDYYIMVDTWPSPACIPDFDLTIEEWIPAHCTSTGNTTFGTAVTTVIFNTINNATLGKTNPYEDFYGSISTTVNQNSSYDLTVNMDTDGDYTCSAMAWIDWNNDFDFDDPGETYDLGSNTNVTDGPGSNCPLSVTIPVPPDAILGDVRMRTSVKYGTTGAGACDTGYDGEVEDYKVTIIP